MFDAAVTGVLAHGPQYAFFPEDCVLVHHRFISVDQHRVFFREAGDREGPTVLLLHGFPTSSHMFRNLIPLLEDQFHIVAPDLPGFGFTVTATDPPFRYTFDALARVVAGFTRIMGLTRYAVYVFDYGAPIGFRLALAHPDRIAAIVTQNGNAYEEGLSAGWDPVRRYWSNPSAENRAALRQLLSAETTKWQYLHGVSDEALIAPEAYTLDHALLQRPGADEIQLDLFLDYANNVALYPKIHEYFATHRPPLLAVWGKNDPFFLPAGAAAFRRDNPNAEVHLYDAGHFALESHTRQIGERIKAFLSGLVTNGSFRDHAPDVGARGKS